jgi:quercetin dioxygenase-like cupin family protein
MSRKGMGPRALAALGLLSLICGAARAGDAVGAGEVVPTAERARIDLAATGGPAETRGVSSTRILGGMDLERDFPAMKGYRMRARVVTLDPGGVIAVHQHDSRPAVAYLLEGEVTEMRGRDEAITYGAGQVAFEQSGLVHWWENRSDAPATVLVVDIVPKD